MFCGKTDSFDLQGHDVVVSRSKRMGMKKDRETLCKGLIYLFYNGV